MRYLFLFLLYNFLHKALEFTINPFDFSYKSSAIIGNLVIPIVLILPISFSAWKSFRKKGRFGYIVGSMIGLFNLFIGICRHGFVYDFHTWVILLGLVLVFMGTGLSYNWISKNN